MCSRCESDKAREAGSSASRSADRTERAGDVARQIARFWADDASIQDTQITSRPRSLNPTFAKCHVGQHLRWQSVRHKRCLPDRWRDALFHGDDVPLQLGWPPLKESIMSKASKKTSTLSNLDPVALDKTEDGRKDADSVKGGETHKYINMEIKNVVIQDVPRTV